MPPDIAFAEERRQLISSLLQARGRVTVEELAALFNVSKVTVRKDLAWLESQGLVTRTHGGAIPAGQTPFDLAFSTRMQLHAGEKECIGRAAAALVQDGDSIAIDASTTVLKMVRHLMQRTGLTVIANGLRAAEELVAIPGINAILPGGLLSPNSLSLVGHWGEKMLEEVHIQKVFVGGWGFTLEEGLTDINIDDVRLKRSMIAAAKEVYVLIDHSKWGRLASTTFCPTADIKTILTDAQAPDAMVIAARQAGIDVRLV